MSINYRLVRSTEYNPWYNLALEEYLLDSLQADTVILYLWQNDSSVFIGRNQNPWRECRLEKLQEDGGYLARRYTGGGAVYHDRGNLNFSLLVSSDSYDEQKQFAMLLDAVRSCGIKAELSGRNDLVSEGRKFSGSAFYKGKEKSCHHGTFLLNSNLDALTYYLQRSGDDIKARGIESVCSPVVNLVRLKPDLTLEELQKELLKSSGRYYGEITDRREVSPAQMGQLQSFYQKNSSKEWLLGKTPFFKYSLKKEIQGEQIEFVFAVKNGLLENVLIRGAVFKKQKIKKQKIKILKERLLAEFAGDYFDRERIIDYFAC